MLLFTLLFSVWLFVFRFFLPNTVVADSSKKITLHSSHHPMFSCSSCVSVVTFSADFVSDQLLSIPHQFHYLIIHVITVNFSFLNNYAFFCRRFYYYCCSTFRYPCINFSSCVSIVTHSVGILAPHSI